MTVEETAEQWPALPNMDALPTPPTASFLQRPALFQQRRAINPDSEQLIAELIALIPQEQMTADIQKRVGQASVDQTQKQGKIMHRMVMDQTQLTLKADPAAFSATWEASALQLLELWKNQRTASLPWTLTQTGKPSLWLAFRM